MEHDSSLLIAHGVGGREDLPIPLSYALTGAVVALVISFTALGLLWRTPILRGDRAGRRVPPVIRLPPHLGQHPDTAGVLHHVWGHPTDRCHRVRITMVRPRRRLRGVLNADRAPRRPRPQAGRETRPAKPLNGLDNLTPAPGLVATVAVLLGSTAYDGFSSSPLWTRFQQQVAIGQTATATLGLVATVLAVAATYTAAVWLTAILGHPKERRAHLPAAFAHSVIPVAVGYLVAHYFSLFVFEGQRTLILASDPMVTGADLFGTAGHPTDYLLVPASTIAILQVAAVVAGHLVGVIAAHDRATRIVPRRTLIAQLPMLALMVTYTLGGLTLLLAR